MFRTLCCTLTCSFPLLCGAQEGLSLVWLDYDPAGITCSEWLLDLFSTPETTARHQVNLDRTLFEDHALMVISKTQDPDNLAYLQECRNRGLHYGLIHLRDEVYEHDTSLYQDADFVFREYWHKQFDTQPSVLCLPLGFRLNAWEEKGSPDKDIYQRSYLWSFAGNYYKSTRLNMIFALAQLPRGKIETSLTQADYRDLLYDTLFAPCPRGWWNLDSFRLLEALESGCIPIVEKWPLDYFEGLFGSYPFLAVSSWEEAPWLIYQWCQDPEALEQKRQECYLWWQQYKQTLKDRVFQLIHNQWILL